MSSYKVKLIMCFNKLKRQKLWLKGEGIEVASFELASSAAKGQDKSLPYLISGAFDVLFFHSFPPLKSQKLNAIFSQTGKSLPIGCRAYLFSIISSVFFFSFLLTECICDKIKK